MRALLLTLTFAIALSGCTDPELTAQTYTLSVDGVPDEADGPFNFTLRVHGHMDHMSDHIGAHYWNSSVSDPSAAMADSMPCEHDAGEAPGEFVVTCDMEPGTWHVRGHMRMAEGEMHHNYWSEPFVVNVTAPGLL